MNRRNEREYDRFEDDDDPRGAERAVRQREQSERAPNQRYPQASERGYDRGSYSQPGYAQRNYDENNFQRAGYDRNREEQYGQRDFGRSWQEGQEGGSRAYGQHYAGQGNYSGQSSYSGRSEYSPSGYGSYDTRGRGGYDPSPRFGDSIRSDWSSVNDSRGGWSRPASSSQESSNLRQGGFYGKGPKGYTRSDERIREDVCDRLSADDELDASDITVTVSAGEVTLEGTVPDRRSKHRAEDLSDSIAGVTDVHNRLRAQKGLVKEVSDKLLGRDEAQTEHHAGSGTRNTPAGPSLSSSRTGASSTTNESLNHR
jgi:osmotically-inducible protein OsmY